ncbi:hypothetical protein Angca_000475, partial [Angiostrongylus cantonensis]
QSQEHRTSLAERFQSPSRSARKIHFSVSRRSIINVVAESSPKSEISAYGPRSAMSQFLIFIAVIVINTIDSRIIRQIEEEQSDMAVADWDPTIRNRFESCHSIASFAPTSEQYCKAFNMCCSMLFDPNNGDKCQTNEQRCIPLEDGDADAVCIQRNCTELVTTTTTTTTEAPVSEETSLNIAGSTFFTTATLLSLWLLQ